jgi:8-oxo-dGTP diphosphatase
MSPKPNSPTLPAIRVTVKMIFRHGDECLYYKTSSGGRDFPGGRVEYGEKLIDALRRELKEELHFELTEEPKLVDVVAYTPDDRSVHHLIIGYTMELPDKPEFQWHDDSDYEDQKLEFHWVNKEDIRQGGFYPNHERLLLKATGQI